MPHDLSALRSRTVLAAGFGVLVLSCSSEPSPPPSPSECREPIQLLDSRGQWSGLQQCADGKILRIEPVVCDPSTHAARYCDPDHTDCEDASCTAGLNGRCAPRPGDANDTCGCVYSCSVDSDCREGSICVCAGSLPHGEPAWSQCIPAGCTAGGDCASGACGVASVWGPCGAFRGIAACYTGDDGCRTHAKCEVPHTPSGGTSDERGECRPLDDDAAWACHDDEGVLSACR